MGLGSSKWSAVFGHAIVIERRWTWECLRWVIGLFWRGFGLQHTRGLHGYPVNRWSTKRTPIDPKLDRRSTGAIPRPHGKPRSNPRKLNTRSRINVKGEAGEHRSAGLQNGQRGKCSDSRD